MGYDVFQGLAREWRDVVESPAARRAVAAWRDDPVLREIQTLDEVLELTAEGLPPGAANVVLLALVRRAGHDVVAARSVLQALVPGLRGVVFRMGGASDGEVAAEVVAAAWARIRAYPVGRRSERVAANVVLDALHVVWMQRLVSQRELPADPERFWSLSQPEATGASRPDAREVLETVAGHVPSAQLCLVADAVLDGRSASEAARDAGITVKAMERRRDRARAQVVKAYRRVSVTSCTGCDTGRSGRDCLCDAISA